MTATYLHGTAVTFSPGDLVEPGRASNFQAGRISNHVYFTSLDTTAAWGAQLAAALNGAPGDGYVYVVQPTGPFEDDPNVTDKKFPGNPTRSFRSRDPLVVVERVDDWPRHSPEALNTMLAGIQRLREQGLDVIDD